MSLEAEQQNYEVFRDCLSNALIDKLSVEPKKERKRAKSKRKSKELGAHEATENSGLESNDAEELGEFVDYLATEIFTSLHEELRTLSYARTQKDPSVAEKYSLPLTQSLTEDFISTLPVSVTESLATYTLITSPHHFYAPILTSYITSTTSPPPPFHTTRATSCELCFREYIPLTYHHLIPKAVHAKVLKRGWHEEWELNKVAWLCRACHSFVHGVAGNEELAREWYSVELLAGREDVRGFVGWVGKVRWKKR
ncbi:hypothetical protein EJ08DRAFT_698116 [Tothia fuscella]|uniref:HNH domain-containing protein n=1 Tax=Tothia fuscella TaxID=1048955 RepID=A0A9P4TWT5_9PEZI|nr:hypothetical protein EJ08DRAFT_698116 [Tothia fuscella]